VTEPAKVGPLEIDIEPLGYTARPFLRAASMPRPKQVSDEQLLLAARKVFLKDGFKAPVSAVAKELGVTPAALFHRVKSKELLFIHALWPKDPPELKILEGRPAAGRRVQEQLIEILFSLTAYLSHAVPAIFHLHSGGVPVGRKHERSPPLLRLHFALAKWLRYAASRKRIRIGNATVAAEALLGALETRYLRGYLLGETFTPAANRAFVRALVAEIIH
jgi:AcrR family transcriptional regulator